MFKRLIRDFRYNLRKEIAAIPKEGQANSKRVIKTPEVKNSDRLTDAKYDYRYLISLKYDTVANFNDFLNLLKEAQAALLNHRRHHTEVREVSYQECFADYLTELKQVGILTNIRKGGIAVACKIIKYQDGSSITFNHLTPKQLRKLIRLMEKTQKPISEEIETIAKRTALKEQMMNEHYLVKKDELKKSYEDEIKDAADKQSRTLLYQHEDAELDRIHRESLTELHKDASKLMDYCAFIYNKHMSFLQSGNLVIFNDNEPLDFLTPNKIVRNERMKLKFTYGQRNQTTE